MVKHSGLLPAAEGSPRAEPTDFQPIRLLEIELSEPLSAVGPVAVQPNERVRVFVRLHGQPLGLVDLIGGEAGLEPGQAASYVWRTLGEQVNHHLWLDELPPLSGLDVTGVVGNETPRCIRNRAAFLNSPPFVSVVVPTRERPDRLERCLRSILAMDYPGDRYEVIVVDNIPTSNATFHVVRRLSHEWPQVRYAREPLPGSASARNCGLRAAAGEIVAFADDDVVVDACWLTELVRAFAAADNVGCVTGLILPMELETPAQVWLEQYGGFAKGFSRRIYDLRRYRPDDPLFPYRAGMFGSGASMAFKRSVLKQIGGFDPTLGNGTPTRSGVDVESFFRTVISGYSLVYEPAAIVHHAHHREYGELDRVVYSYGVGMTAFLTKSLITHPRLALDFAGKLPRGLVFMLSRTSELHASKGPDYPKELTWHERKGLLFGPIAYIRSRYWWSATQRQLRNQGVGWPLFAAADTARALSSRVTSDDRTAHRDARA